MEKKPLSEVIQLVTEANHPYAGSMYTKEDVLRILNEIADQSKLSKEQIAQLKSEVNEAIQSVDKDDVCENFDFEIKHGDTIQVDTFDFNTDKISNEANSAIDDFFSNL